MRSAGFGGLKRCDSLPCMDGETEAGRTREIPCARRALGRGAGTNAAIYAAQRCAKDSRGWFAETYNAARLKEFGIENEFAQDNHAFSSEAGIVRGLHFQRPPAAQAKLVHALRGAIFDVAVDLRKKSASYGKFVSAKLSAAVGEQLFIPAGFAHGYCTLDADTEVLYKVDAAYAPAAEGGIVWNDSDLAISWPVDAKKARLPEKDLALPRFRDFESPF